MRTFWTSVLSVVLPSLATAISGLVLRLLSQQLKKVKLELTAEQQAQIAKLVEDAVLAVEELARRNPGIGGEQKAELAAGIVQEKYPDLPRAVVDRLIDAALQRTRPR